MQQFQLTVTLPIVGNEGKSTATAHAALRELLETFYSKYSVRHEDDLWRNADEQVIVDSNLVYSAIGSALQANRLVTALPKICKLAGQDLVMVTQTALDLQFIGRHYT